MDAKAAERVLVPYGTPSRPEGIEARQAMLGRQTKAEEDCHDLIGEVIANAVVLKGGGIEEYGTKLGEKLQAAASEASLARLFPEFNKADHSGWGTAVKRAKEGSDRCAAHCRWSPRRQCRSCGGTRSGQADRGW